MLDQSSHQPVSRARLLIQGTAKGVETDFNGSFSLELPEGAVVLDISAQGYQPRIVWVPATQETLTLSLEPHLTEERRVSGRASEVARRNLATSVGTVDAESLRRAPGIPVEQAILSRVAGVHIQFHSGLPGDGVQLRLRGISTANGQSAPLYVIDNVLVSDTAIASGIFAVTPTLVDSGPEPTLGNTTGVLPQDTPVNSLAGINPYDIESIQILKGASAASIYGSKASGGAVIIDTKLGRAGEEPQLHITQRVGMYTLANKLGSRRFHSEDEVEKAFGPRALESYRRGKTYDHEAELANRRALSTETAASLSGISGDTRYFGSVLIKDDNGIVPNTGYQKQSFRLSAGQRLGELIDVTATINLIHSLSDRGFTQNDHTDAGVAYDRVPAMLPFTPNFYDLKPKPDGTYPENPFTAGFSNPLRTAFVLKNNASLWRTLASGKATLHLYKDQTRELRLLASFGMDRSDQENNVHLPEEDSRSEFNVLGPPMAGTVQARTRNADVNAVYSVKSEGAGLTSTTSVGVSFEERDLNPLYIFNCDVMAGQPRVDGCRHARLRQDLELVRDRGYYLQEDALLLDQRWTLTAALRGEQSSTHGNVHKVFVYPKLATAYRVPSFSPQVDELKLRLAYGETSTPLQYGLKFSPLLASFRLEGHPTLIRSAFGAHPNLHPERQREVEAGVDALFLSGNIVAEVTVYQRTTRDLVLGRPIAPSSGFSTQLSNGGSLRNRGVEVMLQLNPFHGAGLEWVSNTTFTLNRSKVTELPVPFYYTGGFGTPLGAFRLEQGQSTTQIVGNAGLKEDGTCCVVRKLGDTEPDFRMGFSHTFRYRSVSLSFLLDWQQGSDVINLTRFLYDLGQNSPDFVEKGQQRLRDHAINAGVYIEDASFLKLREITLMYPLPGAWVSRVPLMKSARLSFSARNVFTVTGYSGLDPEVSNFGTQVTAHSIDVSPVPTSRSFWTSLDVGF
jgi:TonB-linked SusC/RagA family outer membrane protein